ncbi:autotransporter domain-containing protein [Pseudomonas sp. R2.Fl]|nr:autotransporter domain-containing protein [Pseudomonas sp. R2.Fl]
MPTGASGEWVYVGADGVVLSGQPGAAANLVVGDGGSASLRIEDDLTGETIRIAYSHGEDATVDIVNDALVTLIGGVLVGDAGIGRLNLDGAEIDADSLRAGEFDGYGEINMSNGSLIDLTSSLQLGGDTGNGRLNIRSGSTVTASDAILGWNTDAEGSVTISGTNSRLLISNYVYYGRGGSGSLLVEDGGYAESGNTIFGLNPDSYGEGAITGTGSRLHVNGTLFVGSGGVGDLTIADGGVVESPSFTSVANGAGSEGSINIGAKAGHAAAAPGTIFTSAITFGAGDGRLVFNHTGNDYVFEERLVGDGTLLHLAGDTILSGDQTGFTGTLDLRGGKLSVEVDLASASTTVNAGGLLGGTGSLGAVTVASGGTVAPGNSIGTLTVASADFTSGSIYSVEIDETSSDLLHATGGVTVDSGGVVHFGPENGTDDGSTYIDGKTYTILTADGGLTGAFGSVTDDFAFLTGSLTYDLNNVYLTVRHATGITFGDYGDTPNQVAVGDALDTLPATSPLYVAALGLATDDVLEAYDALSGEIHATAAGVLMEDGRHVREAISQRLEDAAEGSRGAWFTGYGSWTEWDSDGNAATASAATGGVVAGADTMAGDWRIGAAAAYGNTSIDVDDRSSDADSDNFTLASYAATRLGGFGIRLGGAFTWHEIDTHRSVNIAGLGEDLNADYGGSTAQLFGQVDYRFAMEDGFVAPFAGLSLVRTASGDYDEGSGVAALDGQAQAMEAAVTDIGVRLSRLVDLDGKQARLKGGLAWQHVFGDVTPTTTHAFEGSADFTVAGTPLGRDMASVEAGVEIPLTASARLGVGYTGRFGADAEDHQIKGRLDVTF